jgi:hypothetical protein
MDECGDVLPFLQHEEGRANSQAGENAPVAPTIQANHYGIPELILEETVRDGII